MGTVLCSALHEVQVTQVAVVAAAAAAAAATTIINLVCFLRNPKIVENIIPSTDFSAGRNRMATENLFHLM